MVTCIQCGNVLSEGETNCSRCGATMAVGLAPEPPVAAAPDAPAGAEEHAPAGTWSEGGTGEQVKVPENDRVSSPWILTFRETPHTTDDRPVDAPPLRPERTVRDPDLTPVPGLAVALASRPRPRDEESSGTRPTRTTHERPMGQVVPLRREPRRVAEPSSPEQARRAAGAATSAGVTIDDDAIAEDARPGVGSAPETGEAPAERERPDASERTRRADGSAGRPPVLASESLREDLTPTEPGRSTLRWVAALLGPLGAALVVAFGGTSGFGLLVAALLVGAAVLGLVPMRYEARATGITAVGAAGLVVVVVATGVMAVPPVLTLAVTVLAAGLIFRGTYRASSLARWMTGAGVALGLAWFVGSGTIAGLNVMDTSWQSVTGAIVRLAFGLLLLLSLLAFMDSSTTAGCRVWGTALLVWYAAFSVLELAVRMWPAPGQPRDAPDGLVARVLPTAAGPPTAEVTALTFGAAALVALTALAASQVLVSVAGGTVTKRQADANGGGTAEEPAE